MSKKEMCCYFRCKCFGKKNEDDADYYCPPDTNSKCERTVNKTNGGIMEKSAIRQLLEWWSKRACGTTARAGEMRIAMEIIEEARRLAEQEEKEKEADMAHAKELEESMTAAIKEKMEAEKPASDLWGRHKQMIELADEVLAALEKERENEIVVGDGDIFIDQFEGYGRIGESNILEKLEEYDGKRGQLIFRPTNGEK